MFTGIIKNQAELIDICPEDTNLRLRLKSVLVPELSIDQSVAHNGVCLTVDQLHEDSYEVIAIQESIDRTTIKNWKKGQLINLELAMKADALLDGHMLQGHVDKTLTVKERQDKSGSIEFEIAITAEDEKLLVEKGSVALDGISLTCFGLSPESFKVAIIPYTLAHTSIQNWEKGSQINVEFDILNKIISKKVDAYFSQKDLQK